MADVLPEGFRRILANALTNATGIRFHDSSMTPDRIYRRIFESSQSAQGRNSD